MRKTISELFAESHGKPVHFEGHEVHSIYRVPISTPTALKIRFHQSSEGVRQGLRLAVDNGALTVNGETLTEVVLWTDTAPQTVRVQVTPSGRRCIVMLWNAWEDETGVMQAWIGDCGMLVEVVGGSVTLRCSDGVGRPDFNDLAVTVTGFQSDN